MAKKVKIEFISDGFRQILSCSDTAQVVDDSAHEIASNASAHGGEWMVDGFQGGFGGGRYIGIVAADDYEAMYAEAVDKALSTAVH